MILILQAGPKIKIICETNFTFLLFSLLSQICLYPKSFNYNNSLCIVFRKSSEFWTCFQIQTINIHIWMETEYLIHFSSVNRYGFIF